MSCPPSELRERNEPKGWGFGVETERSGAEVPVRWEMLREREQGPRCRTIQSQAERRDCGQTEKSLLLYEGIDTSLYALTRKSKIETQNSKQGSSFSVGGERSRKLEARILFSADNGRASPPYCVVQRPIRFAVHRIALLQITFRSG